MKDTSKNIYELRDYLKRYSVKLAELVLDKDKSGKGYICPFCGSGSGGNGTGLVWYERDERFSCFACSNGKGVERDIIDLYMQKSGLDFIHAIKELCGLIGEGFDYWVDKQDDNEQKNQKTPEKETIELVQGANYFLNIAEYYKKLGSKIDLLSNGEVLKYLAEKRGLDNLDINSLLALGNIGYDDYHKGVMFICNRQNGATNTRLFNPLGNVKALKSKGVQDSYFWNFESVKKHDVTFFCEGEIDALTIINHGYNAVSYGSCNALGKLADKLNKDFARDNSKFFIICPDNDSSGFNSIKAFQDKYKGVNYYVATIPSYPLENKLVKDINDLHLYNKETCKNWLKNNIANIEVVKAEIRNIKETLSKDDVELLNCGAHKQQLLNSILCENTTIHLSPRFQRLDETIGGFNVGLNFIGGGSGSGKTTVAMQMIEDFASLGYKCLVFSTEMSERNLITRSMARYGLEQRFNTKSTPILTNKQTREITPFDEKANADKTFLFNGYMSEIKDNVYINSCTNEWESIKQNIIKFASCYQDKQHVILMDFIQNIISETEETIERLRQILAELKVLAIEYNLVILAISALNRAGQRELGNTELSALRDTSNLEYLAESVLFVESGEPFAYKTITKQNKEVVAFDINKKEQYEYKEDWLAIYSQEEYKELCNNICGCPISLALPNVTYTRVVLSVKKNRYGDNDKLIPYKFYKAYSCYQEIADDSNLKEIFNFKRRTEMPKFKEETLTVSLEDFGLQPENMTPDTTPKKEKLNIE